MCGFHYRKWRRYGNPKEPPKRNKFGQGNITVDGYRRITVNGIRILEHRYIMENIVKRKLIPSEHVHHKNHNTLDNRPENLEILTNIAHKILHLKEYWSKKERKWSLKYNLDFCLLCGMDSIAHASHGHCRSCVRRVNMWAGIQK